MAYEFEQLVPELRPYAEALLQALNDAGLNPRVTSTLRSSQTQRRLYETYLKGASRYPAAPPGWSPHEHGWAFDLSINDDSWLADAGDLWESWGGTWGGNFHDPIHFELGGASQYLRSLREAGQPPPPPPGARPGQLATALYGPVEAVGSAVLGSTITDWILGPPPS